ncbi:hypothetical protein WNY63_18205, partial [Pseudoalteromonas neustonica]
KNELSLDLNFIKSNRQQKLPVVLTQAEVSLFFKHINKRHYLIASLLYPCFATRCQWRSEPVFEIIIAEA